MFLRAALLLLLTFITFASLIGWHGQTCLSVSTAYAQSWDELAGSATGGGVSNKTGHSGVPSLALDSSGRPHIAWYDESEPGTFDFEIYYTYWDGSNWVTHGGANTGGGVSNNAGFSWNPSLALDSSGNPHIAWDDTSDGDWEIYYAYWDGSGWVTHGGANAGGGVSNNAGHSDNPSLALDSSGNPHIAWEDDTSDGDWEIYYAYWSGSSWVTHGGGNTGGGVSNNTGASAWPSLALDSFGNPHIAWQDVSYGNDEIYYAYWDGANWVTHGGADTGGGVSNNAGLSHVPSLTLDRLGNPHIAWDDTSGGGSLKEIYYAYWDGSNWVTHDGANTGGGVSNNTGNSDGPSLALDSLGNPHIAWRDVSGVNREIYYAYWDGTNWVTHGGANTGGGLSNNASWSERPSLVLDSSGNPHIAWRDWSGSDWEIYYRYWNPGVTPLEKPQAKHVVIIDIDGLRPDIFKEELEAGNLSTFQYLMGGTSYDNPGHAIVVKDARTGFPSLTLPGHASIFTGCYIKKHGIVGNSWFDRFKGKLGDAHRHLGWWNALFDFDDANKLLLTQTIYEVGAKAKRAFTAIVGFNYYAGKDWGKYKNKQIWWLSPYADRKLFPANNETNDFDEMMMYRVFETLNGKYKWDTTKFPSILTLYFTAVDHEAHYKGTDNQREDLAEIDALLWKLINGGEIIYPTPRMLEDTNADFKVTTPPFISIKFKGLKNIGTLFDDTVFVICADHGHTPVNKESAICYGNVEKVIEDNATDYDIERFVAKRRGENNSKSEKKITLNDRDVKIEFNDGMAHIYVKREEKKRTGWWGKWKDTPDPCKDIIPFASILHQTEAWFDPDKDYILNKENKKNRGEYRNMILVKVCNSKCGEDDESGQYKVFTGGDDPLACNALAELTDFFSDDEAKRINNLYSPRSGEIIIMANYSDNYAGFYLEDDAWGGCADMYSTHGNINSSDLKIPFIIAGKNVKSYSVPSAEQVDIAHTIADILEFSMPGEGTEGYGKSIFKK